MEIFHFNLTLFLLILIPLYFLITFISRNDQNKPNFPPGPPKLPIIGNLHQLGKPLYQGLSKLSKIYGPVMLLQFGSVPTVVISSAKAAEQVMKTLDVEFCSRVQLAGRKQLSYNYTDMAFAPYGDYWREVRKICVLELYSRKRVQSFKLARAEEIDVLINSISSSKSAPVNVFEKLTSFGHNTVCRVAFGSTAGESMNRFDNGRLTKLFPEIAVLTSLSASDFFPKVSWFIDWITGIHGKTEKCFHELDNFLQQIIDEHDNPERLKHGDEDIIDALLKLRRLKRVQFVSLTTILKQLFCFLNTYDFLLHNYQNVYMGGVETAGSVMTWAMAELAKNPKAMKKVQEEIRSYVGSKGKVEESDLDNFHYLKMVVKETLRLHPSCILLTRECLKHNKIDGYDIYPKTRILINIWALGRNLEYWENPEEFLPDRFRDSPVDFVENLNFEYIPFGGGRRICPGLNMGIVLTELVLANVLYTFDWEFPKGLKREDLNMESSGCIYTLELVPIKHVVTKSD